jgi:hypothetical protein
MADFNDFASYFGPTPDAQPQINQPNPAFSPSGTGNWFTAGLGSGFHQALSEVGSAGEAGARAFGADSLANSARNFADAQRASAATYARPDLESGSWYDPRVLAYRLTQSVPTFAGALAGGALAAAAAPEVGAAGLVAGGLGAEEAAAAALAGTAARKSALGLVGSTLAMYPSSVGGNVQRNEDYEGDLSQTSAQHALELGVPEALVQGVGPHWLEKGVLSGFGGGLAGTAAKAFGIQAGAGAATEWAMQAMGDPNRSLADRANDIVTAGLSGGLLGGVTAGILHPFSPAHTIAKTPPMEVPTEGAPNSLQNVVDATLQPPQPGRPMPAGPGQIIADRIAQIAQRPTAADQNMQLPPAPPPSTLPQTSPLDQLAAIRAGAPIQMPPPADEAARLQQAQLDAARAARPSTRAPGTLADRLAAVQARPGGADQNIPAPPVAPGTEPYRPFAGPPGASDGQKLLAPPLLRLPAPTPTPDAPQPFDWAATRKQLQQVKGYSPALRGPFDNVDDLKNTVYQNVIKRVQAGDDDLKPWLSNAAAHLGILDEGTGEFTPEFKARAAQDMSEQLPPGVTSADNNAAPIPGPVTPTEAPAQPGTPGWKPADPVDRGAVPEAHQKRWDALDQQRRTLLGDNLSDFRIQELLDKTTALQDRLLSVTKSGDNSWRNVDRATKEIQAQVTALHTQAAVDPQPPATEKTAPANGPQPSPAASAFVGRMKKAVADPAFQPLADQFQNQLAGMTAEATGGQTKEAQAKAKRKGKVAQAPAPEAPAAAVEDASTLKERDAAQAIASGEAPASLTPEEAAAAQPDPRYPAGTTLPPREDAIERDGRLWDYRQNATPPDIEARAQQAEKAALDPRLVGSQPQDVPTAARRDFATAEDRARAARAAVEAKRPTTEAQRQAQREAYAAARGIDPEQARATTRGAKADQHTIERVNPRLVSPAEDEAEIAARAPSPTDERRAANNAALPPAVDPSLLSGFERTGRRAQADAVREAKNDTLRAKLSMIESGKRPVVPVPTKVIDQLNRAKAALDALRTQGAIVPRHEDFEGKDTQFQQRLSQHADQLNLVDRAVKLGGMEGLREVPRDFFGTDLYDEMSGHVTPQTERNLLAHATAETQLQDAAAAARGERPLVSYSEPPTQHDVDLQHIVNQTGDMKSVLGYLRENGSNSTVKMLAHKLLTGGAGGTVAMSDRAQVREGAVMKGMHFADANHTEVYDGSTMEHTLLHEAAHSAMQRAIDKRAPGTDAINSLYESLKKAGGDDYGLTNLHEFVSEAFSNPQFQQYLNSIRVTPDMSMWQRFKNGVARVLGLGDKSRSQTALDYVMDHATRMMGENVREANTDYRVQARRGGQLFSEASTQLGNAMDRALWKEVGGLVKDSVSKLGMKAREGAFAFETGDMLKWHLQEHVPSAVPFVDTQNHRTVRTDTLAKNLVRAYDQVHKLAEPSREAWARLAAHTAQRINGFKTWEEHTWLKDHPQVDALHEEWQEANRDANVIRNDPAAMKAWQDSINANEGAKYLRNLHLLNDYKAREWEGENWSGYETDPIRDYEGRTDLQDNPAAARAWGKAEQEKRLAGLAKKVNDLDTLYNSQHQTLVDDAKLPGHMQMSAAQLAKLNEDIKTTRTNRDAASSLVRDLTTLEKSNEQVPYFHIGRGKGDHFVSAHVAMDGNVPRDSAIRAISAALSQKGFKDLAIMRGMENPSIYMRVESQAQRAELAAILKRMQAEGHIDAAKPVADGLASDTNIYHSIGPQWMRQIIEGIKSTPPDYPVNTTNAQREALNTAHEQMIREQVRALMDMLPDSSLTKAYQKREGVQGFSTDMLNSYKANAVSASRGLSNVSLARELGQLSLKMKEELDSVNIKDLSPNTKTTVAQALGELVLRNKLYQQHVPSTFMDGVRRTVHAVQIGASPAYFMTLMSQIPSLTLPELAKTHGYVGSASAMARATNDAFKVMKAVWSDGKGGFHMGDDAITFGMRRDALERAGFKPDMVDFLMNLASRGAFNQGAYTEAMTGHQVDSAYGALLQKASVLGRYSEQFPRVLTAIASKILHEDQQGKVPNVAGGQKMTREEFAYRNVMNSQFNWNPELNARETTRSGKFGAYSPLINQFMGFQIRMTEKLYREVATGFANGNWNSEDAKASRTWLYGHAAVVTALAGTLGLPMVGVAASVYDRLADWLGDTDDHDITASYRSFLAHSFGKEYGEAIARGAPRLAGLDFDHLGEGTIAPGSKMIMFATEKRKLEDAEKDWLRNMAGSSMGFLANTATGARDLMNGDYLDGLTKFSPEILKGGVEAFRLGKYGFVDKNGSKLPITASASDVMMKALGIDPAKEAEYDEEKRVATGLQTMRQMRSQNITRHLMLATNRGDEGNFQSWQSEAMKFAMDHPGMGNPLSDFGRAMALHSRNAAVAQGFGTPIGVQPRDRVGQEMTNFGNLRNGEN